MILRNLKKKEVVMNNANLHADPNENKMVQCPAPLIGSGAMAPINNGVVDNMEIKVQVWRSARDAENNNFISVENLVKLIIKSEFEHRIIKLRKLYMQFIETGDMNFKKEYDSLKPKLPLITFSSIFDNRRDEEHMICSTDLIVLDIDLKDNPDLPIRINNLRRELIDCPFSHILFVSPSGEGLKIVVKVHKNKEIINCNKELKICKDTIIRKELIETIKDFHCEAHKQIRKYYSNKYDIMIDNGAKNYQGVCFLSSDANVYYNPNSSPFPVAWVKKEKKVPQMNTYNTFNYNSTSNDEILEAILNDFTKNCSGRNAATFAIALQAKHYNISENEVLSFVMRKWGDVDFTEKEALRTIRNGFKYTPYVQYVFNSNNSNNI